MTGTAHQKAEMEEQKTEETGEMPGTQENAASAGALSAGEDYASELHEPRWAVVTFDRCAASGLTYDQAAEHLKRLEAEKVSGLCIVPDEAAERLAA